MNTLEKEFVTYQQALKLKALGFDEPCFGYYHTLGSQQLIPSLRDLREDNNDSIEYFLAPTFSQAFRWFREKHDLPSNLELFDVGWDYVIYLDITEEIDFNEGPWNTYEEAELACLLKLIEIVKNK